MKIFVSVGTQLPFERMLRMVEDTFSSDEFSVVYQVGDSNFTTQHGQVHQYLDPEDYNKAFENCDIFISHAGMGSIITALENGKNIIVVPRLYSLQEHRNDHQISTAKKFQNNKLVTVVNNPEELRLAYEAIVTSPTNKIAQDLSPDEELIGFLRGVIGC